MRFRPVIFAWCLLFGATLAMAAAAWWLLGREADGVFGGGHFGQSKRISR